MFSDKNQTCCFSGHRILPKNKMENILERLNFEIDTLISQGVTDFISGGALGFDQIVASMIIAKKEMGYNIRLALALPCRNQDKFWSVQQRKLYFDLLSEVDEIIYVSEEYYDGCMDKRNRYMVEKSAYCICALLNLHSGTGNTTKYARQNGLKVINVIE